MPKFLSDLLSSDEKGVDHTVVAILAALIGLLGLAGWAAYQDAHLVKLGDFADSATKIIGLGGVGKGLRDLLSSKSATTNPEQKP